MKRGLMVFGVLFLLMVSMVLAGDTTITVKTKADRDVEINVMDNNDNVINEFKNKSDSNGEYQVDLSTSKSSVNVVVNVRKNGKFEYGGPQRYDNQKTSRAIVIDLEGVEEVLKNGTEEIGEVIVPVEEVTKPVEKVVESEAVNTSELVVEPTPEETEVVEGRESNKITGRIIGGGKSIINSKVTYYLISGIVVIGILFFLILIAKKKINKKKPLKITNIRDLNKKKYDSDLEDAEKKLDEAKQELDELKDRKRKLAEAREKFKRDQEELKKIEEEY